MTDSVGIGDVPMRRRAAPADTRLRGLVAWILLGVAAMLSGAVAVVMLSAWSETLVTRASGLGPVLSGLVTIGGGYGLFLLTAAFLVLVAAMVRIWVLGAVLGGHLEGHRPLAVMLALDVGLTTVSALGGGVGLVGCATVGVLDLGVLAVLGLPSWRRDRAR